MAALLLLFLCLPALAANALDVNGTIQDSAGSPLGGARITLTGASGEARGTVSDANGWMAFEGVEPGEYVLRVEAKAHQPLEMPVRVTLEPPSPLKIRLKLGITEEVNVTALDPDEDATASANNADVVELDDRLIQGLPVPLGSDGLVDFMGTYVSPAAQGTGAVAIVVDGSDSESLAVPASSIERIKVNRHPYSAEFRRPGKARLDVKTRRGSTSRFKGAAAFYLQNSALAAKNAFASSKPALNRRLFELSFSGPLSRQLGSFFLSLQHEMNDEEQIVNAETIEGPVNELVPSSERFTSALASLYLRTGIHRFGLRYTYGRNAWLNRGVGGLNLAESGYDSRRGPQHSVQAWARSYLSGHLLNNAHVRFVATDRREGHPTQDPAIEVNGAFTGGSSQVFHAKRSLLLEARESATYVSKAHTLLLGAGFRTTSIDETEASGFGGLFEFASLDDYDQGRPYVYRVNQGNPRLSFTYNEFEAFVQDEVRLRSDLSLMAGLRYDYSSAIDDRNDLAARLSAAWLPGQGKTVCRAGLGFFYERLPVAALERRLLWDGTRIRNIVITDPTYPDPWLGGETTTPPPSLFRLASDLVTPYVFQATVAAEREVSSRARLTLEYLFVRGLHLFRGRDVNAPLSGSGLRPDPTHGEILEGESTGSLRSHALGLTYRGRIGRRVKAQAQYTLGWARNDVGGADPTFPFEVPADSYDLEPEWGRGDFDRRHRFSLAATAELPRRINAGVTLAFKSPAPYDITTGNDDNGDGYAKDRPAGVTRNTGQGPDFFQVDVRLSKGWTVRSPVGGEGKTPGEFQLVVDAYNLTNRVNYSSYIGAMTSPYFGTANSAKQARSLQLAVKYRF